MKTYSINLFIILSGFTLLSLSCAQDTNRNNVKSQLIELQGQTMGTVYSIKYIGDQNFKIEIDSILIDLNNEVSTYIPTSIISLFNQSDSTFCFDVPEVQKMSKCGGCYFSEIYKKAAEIHNSTQGRFDPTIMPLVNFWGFGYTEKKPQIDPQKSEIDSILQFIGLEKINITTNDSCALLMVKNNPESELDFSAIAKGYGVDLIAQFLDSRQINNFMVEIGGELSVKGTNDKGALWSIGINTPKDDAPLNDFKAILQLENCALASSGNYRNYYEIDNLKYGHEIDPISGYPKNDELLSVSVIANNCMEADAYATAFMIMGLQTALAFTNNNPNLEAYFIYGNQDGGMSVKQSDGFGKYILTEK